MDEIWDCWEVYTGVGELLDNEYLTKTGLQIGKGMILLNETYLKSTVRNTIYKFIEIKGYVSEDAINKINYFPFKIPFSKDIPAGSTVSQTPFTVIVPVPLVNVGATLAHTDIVCCWLATTVLDTDEQSV